MALILAVNNGAFAALAFVGVNGQSNAIAASTPSVSLDQSTTKYVPPTSTYPSHTYINGDLNSNNSAYAEGDCVPFRVQLTNLDPATTTTESIVIQYEHFRAGNYGYMSVANFAVDLGSNGSIDLTPTLSPAPDPNATDADQTITATFSTGGATSATLYYCGVLAVPANGHGGISSISGAPVHMRVISGVENGTAYSIGNQDRSIQPAAITPTPALSISKSGPATATLGTAFSYTITVSNTGTGPQTGVSVSDVVPTGLTINTATPTLGTCSVSSQTVTCAVGTVNAATTVTITINVTPTASACGTVNNHATLTPGTVDSNIVSTTVSCPNVSVLKSGSAAVSAGGTATFTIVVTAGGTGDSTSVTLADTLPTGTWTLGGANAGSCSITAGTLSCNFGTMTNGSTRTVTLSRATTSGDCPSISNTATVSAAVDASTANNSSTASITVNCGTIGLTKTADAATVTAGSPIGYVITATNSGAGAATAVTVTDTLPTNAGLSWSIDAAGSTAGCAIASGILTCSFGDLAPGASAHVHLTSPTTVASCGTVSNTAHVATGNDGISQATASVTVNCPPPPALGGIQVTKYNDTNRNGTRDAGEPTLQGFVFTVKSGGVTVATLTTDSTGSATTANLTAGTYTVIETQQAGWTSTDPGTSLTKTVTVNAGQTATVLFGNATVQLPPTSAGTLVVTKYNDLNANKTRDTNEPALSGWTFTVKDGNGATVGTAATDASGNATFQNLSFGTYTVTETLQSGWTSTDPGGATPTKTVTISAATTTVLFGNAQIKLPNTSTLAAPSQAPSPAMLFLLTVLIAQAALLTIVFRRWRND